MVMASTAFLRSHHQDHLYGLHSVASALLSNQRKKFKLFMLNERQNLDQQSQLMIEKAKEQHISIVSTTRKKLDVLAEQRPHQGLVLLASKLQSTRLRALDFVHANEYNGIVSEKESLTFHSTKTPLWIALDQIMDPQNLGAILRSCYFFGIDGIILTQRRTAPLSPVVSKASSGALERMSTFETSNLSSFLKESIENGWHVYGTDIHAPNLIPVSSLSTLEKPTILVMGSEGTGLEAKVSRQCHQHIHIPSMHSIKDAFDVDSLNVSVSTAILLHQFSIARQSLK